MCGFAGFASSSPVSNPDFLRRMNDAIAHRGPDGEGLRLWETAGLAHRRLSIIDVSAAGAQPMAAEDETLWIAYNGEFYNFGDYRRELEQAGHVFRSHCDTETILHLTEQHGIEETLRRMNGMFAFALWNTRERRLILARDRVGKKPLYYVQRPDGMIAFASEIKSLVAGGLVDRTKTDPIAFSQLWQYGYVFGARTMYQDVKRLPPGHYAVWENGRLSVRQYWDCPFGTESPRTETLSALADEMEWLLTDSIRLRLIADVPLGLFLSGGIDSSLVAALAAGVTHRQVETYSVAIGAGDYNEAPHARAVAEHLGLKNHTLSVTDDLRESFAPIARHFDEPFGDSSAIPTWFLCRKTREHVTVALSGDGGDELFAGYDSYAQGLRIWGGQPVRRKEAGWRLRAWEAYIRLAARGDWPRYWTRILTDRKRRKLFREISDAAHQDRMAFLQRAAGADLLSQMQYLDLKLYLPDDVLVKVDRMSMAHALECRCPLLDHRIVEFASRLPMAAKIGPDGRGKVLLRELLARHVPRNLFERPKQGFAIPWHEWCQGEAGRDLRARWQAGAPAMFSAESGAVLFPDDRLGHARLQWNAFVTLMFLET